MYGVSFSRPITIILGKWQLINWRYSGQTRPRVISRPHFGDKNGRSIWYPVQRITVSISMAWLARKMPFWVNVTDLTVVSTTLTNLLEQRFSWWCLQTIICNKIKNPTDLESVREAETARCKNFRWVRFMCPTATILKLMVSGVAQ